MGLSSLCLVDANVVIDGFKYSFFQALVSGHAIGMCGWVWAMEVKYYKGADGTHVPIDLTSYTTAGGGRVEHATIIEMQQFATAYRGGALGRGESESIAMVMGRGVFFFTAARDGGR